MPDAADAPDKLLAQLVADIDSPEADADAAALLPAMQALKQWPGPVSTPAGRARLLAQLQPIQAAGAHVAWPAALRSPLRRLDAAWPWLLLRSQVRVVRGEIWLGSALVLVLGALVTLGLATAAEAGQAAVARPFVLLAPVVAAVGCAFLFGPGNDQAFELALALPASPRLVLLARLAVLFAFDLAFGVLGSILLAAGRSQATLWPLVQAWLAPMACLSAVAFLFSVLFMEPAVGMLVSLVLWGFQVLRPLDPFAFWLLVPDLAAPEARVWLWLAAAALGAAAFWLAGSEERWLRRQA